MQRLWQYIRAKLLRPSKWQRANMSRRLTFDLLEDRRLLAVNDFSIVPLWDGERKDGSGFTLINNAGGGAIAGINASVTHTTTTVHSGEGAYRIDTNTPIAQGNFDFVQTSLGATGFPPNYVDTRDLTHYELVSYWIRNETGAPFTLDLELKDYRDSGAHQAKWVQQVATTNQWIQIQAPLDFSQGWMVTGQPELARARALSLVIHADRGAAVNGSIYVDDLTLIEPGGPVNPASTSFDVLAERLAVRTFDALWGARDRTTGLLPTITSFQDIVALNSTAGLIKSLPGAIERDWITRAEGDAYIATVLQSLDQVLDHSTYLPARYLNRLSLEPAFKVEESSVDAALIYLSLFQYRSLPETSPALRAMADGVLARFDFGSFATAKGWRFAFNPNSQTFSSGTYDGYSTEVGVISLAAELAGQVDIATLYHSGVKRIAQASVNSASTYLVHEDAKFRAPFTQWLLPLFVDVSQRGLDNYPVAELASNPLANAIAYQRDVDDRLANVGRGNLLQSDAGDDFTGSNYEAYSVFNDYGRPALVMPWSLPFALLGDASAAGPALQQLLAADLHGPFGMVDSTYWNTGESLPYDIAARNDLWNSALSLMALNEYLFQDNEYLTSTPEVSAALDKVFTSQAVVTPAAQFLFRSTNLYSVSSYPSDFGSPFLPIYMDFGNGGHYFNGGLAGANVEFTHANDTTSVGYGRTSWKLPLIDPFSSTTPFVEFNIESAGPRDIPEVGNAHTLRFLARSDVNGQALRVNIFKSDFSNPTLTPSVVTLNQGWNEYTIGLPAGVKAADIRSVQFVITPKQPGLTTFWLDEIRLDTDGFDPLRLPQSFIPVAPAESIRDTSVYPAFSALYDNALAIIALLATGDAESRATALQITDALIATADTDGSYLNQRYSGHVFQGDNVLRGPFNGTIRTLGDNAWFGIALMHAYSNTGNVAYLNRAITISDWAETNLRAPAGGSNLGGYYFEIGNTTRSTEQNIDTFALNWQIQLKLAAVGDSRASTYEARALHAGNFVRSMYDPTAGAGGGKFWTGTPPGSNTPNTATVALDVQTWATLALPLSPTYANDPTIDWNRPIAWVEANLATTDGVLSGHKYTSGQVPASAVWFEGTGQVGAVHAALNNETQYAQTLGYLRFAQAMAPNGDGQGIIAASVVGLNDPLISGPIYDPRLHVGATSWLVFAEKRVNPFATGAAPNQAPINTVPATIETNEDSSISVTGISITDADALSNSVSVKLTVSHGTLTLATNIGAGLIAGQLSGNGSGTVTISAPLSVINTTLANSSGLTYLGNLDYNGSDILTVTSNDLGNTGPGGPFTDIDTVAITISSINDAPLLNITGSSRLADIAQDEIANNGTSVMAILASGAGGNPISDADSGALRGVAIVSADTAHGSWEFSTNSGSIWTPLGSVSTSNARLLSDAAATRLRFVPQSGYVTDLFNTNLPAIGFRAWDRTSGAEESLADTTTNGGATSFSTAIETATVRVLNPLFVVNGSTLTAQGSAGIDTIVYQQLSATTSIVQVNGFSQVFTTAQITAVVLDGRGGDDLFYGLFNIGLSESFIFTPGGMSSTGGIGVTATDMSTQVIYAEPIDSQTFAGSSGDEVAYVYPNAAIVTQGPLVTITVGIGQTILANTAGTDVAVLVESAGDDTFQGRINRSTFSSSTHAVEVNGFEQVYVFGASGNDTAEFFDGAADDVFYGLSSFSAMAGHGFFYEAIGFDSVEGHGSGGTDIAVFYDTAGNDTFQGRATRSVLVGTGYAIAIEEFDIVYALAFGGGTDSGELFDATGDDVLYAEGNVATLFYATGALIQLYNFDTITAHSTSGADIAVRKTIDYVLTLDGPWIVQ